MRSASPSMKQRLMSECDTLWQQLIVSLNWGRCIACGQTDGVAGHHLIKRRYLTFRHDPCNGIPLCFHDHNRMEQMSRHEADAMLLACAPNRHAWLHLQCKSSVVMSSGVAVLKERRAQLRQLLAELEHEPVRNKLSQSWW